MKHFLSVAVLLSGFLVANSAQAKLGVGDKAPALTIKNWIKGAPVDPTKAGPDKVIIVEFWATWCGPCRASMPHISDMQERFKDKGVTFIGVSAEKKSVVEKFLKNGNDEKMRYTIALDNKRQTSKDWMSAAGQTGIPCSFIVKGGKIRWIGHPMNDLDLKVAELCGDTDYLAYKKKRVEIEQELMQAAKAENWSEVLKAFDKMIELDPERFEVLMAKYHLLVTKLDKAKDAAAFGRSIVSESNNKDDLNRLAWTILSHDEFEEHRDVELATAAAKKAVELTEEKSPQVIDTYALALAAAGDLKAAVQWQTKAVKLCSDEDPKTKRKLQRKLEDYEKRANGA
ncbi:MAG: redoxin domain-containing protein [Phycisphaerae bacterium]